jgi:hypothetical protein
MLLVIAVSMCSPLFKCILGTVMLDGFLSSTKRSSSMNLSPPPLPFFRLGVTKETAKPEFFLAIGDDVSSSVLCSTGELMFEKNEAHL